MLNDFFITRDVISYLQQYLARNDLNFPAFSAKLESLALKQNMSFEQWWQLLDELETLHSTPALGLAIGKNIQVQDCGVLGYLFKTSRNLGDALKCFNRFQRLIYAGSVATLTAQGKNLTLLWEPEYGYSSQTSDALLISAMVNIIQNLISPETFPITKIHFTQKIPNSELSLYEAFFQCPILAGQEKLAIDFPQENLHITIPDVDTTLHHILGQQAESLLSRLPDDDLLIVQLRDTILRCLHEGLSDASHVAEQMGLSERTLHRRLQTKGRVYRDVLKEIRKSMSVNYLSDEKLTLSEIALMLGYGEQSTFSRAFKNWYGVSPLKYQKTQLPLD